MAIDTRDKRASAIHVQMPWTWRLLPNPDAPAETQEDRQQIGGVYSGIAAGAPVTPTGGGRFLPIFRPRRR